MVAGKGITIGHVPLGAARQVHVLSPSVKSTPLRYMWRQ